LKNVVVLFQQLASYKIAVWVFAGSLFSAIYG